MTPTAPLQVRSFSPSLVQILGFYALAAYLFFYLGRVFDLLGVNLKITMILNIVFWGAALASGGLALLVKSRVGLMVVLFYICILLSFPFSVWRGGSLETLTIATRSVLLMASIIALSISTGWTLRLMSVIGYSMSAAAVLSTIFGEESERGRLALSSGTLADPNFYAMALLMGLPFVWMSVANGKNYIQRIVPAVATLPIFYAAIKTGSRGGMLALIALFAVLFIRSKMSSRLALVLLVTFGLILTVVLFPAELLSRYTTIFEPPEAETVEQLEDNEIAAASAAARKYLFLRSLELTAKNPLLGVGPGMFSVAENDDAREDGRKGAWHETHNTYTQVSSEIGIPGIIFLTAALIIALRSVYRLSNATPPQGREKEWAPVKQGAYYLFLSLVTVLTGAMFLSIAYTGVLYILAGLSAALERAARVEFGVVTAPERRIPIMVAAPARPIRRHV